MCVPGTTHLHLGSGWRAFALVARMPDGMTALKSLRLLVNNRLLSSAGMMANALRLAWCCSSVSRKSIVGTALFESSALFMFVLLSLVIP